MRAQFVFHEVWIGLRRNLTMTIALVVVVAISLSLLGTGMLFVKQVDNSRSYLQGRFQLSVYLCTAVPSSTQCAHNGPATDSQRAQISQTLKSLPQVANVTYIPQARAVKEFKAEFAQDPSLANDTPAADIPD